MIIDNINGMLGRDMTQATSVLHIACNVDKSEAERDSDFFGYVKTVKICVKKHEQKLQDEI